jgi:hypothetical protein
MMDEEDIPENNIWCETCQGLGCFDFDEWDIARGVGDEEGNCNVCGGRGHHPER